VVAVVLGLIFSVALKTFSARELVVTLTVSISVAVVLLAVAMIVAARTGAPFGCP